MPPNKMLLLHCNTYGCDVTEQTSVGEGVICFKYLFDGLFWLACIPSSVFGLSVLVLAYM